MKFIYKNILKVKKRIFLACKKFNKNEKKISIVAVSKKHSIFSIKKVIDLGLFNFGENYVQEGLKKINFFSNNKKINWHFIGKIQSNKIKFIAKNFSWCQSVENIKIAKKLNENRPKNLDKLNILIQVNIDNEKNKSGIVINEVKNLAEKITKYSRLKLRGLMTITNIEKNQEKQIFIYSQISNIIKDLKNIYPECNILSFGMSNDLEAAIAAGSNMLRIGTAIFGIRKK